MIPAKTTMHAGGKGDGRHLTSWNLRRKSSEATGRESGDFSSFTQLFKRKWAPLTRKCCEFSKIWNAVNGLTQVFLGSLYGDQQKTSILLGNSRFDFLSNPESDDAMWWEAQHYRVTQSSGPLQTPLDQLRVNYFKALSWGSTTTNENHTNTHTQLK